MTSGQGGQGHQGSAKSPTTFSDFEKFNQDHLHSLIQIALAKTELGNACAFLPRPRPEGQVLRPAHPCWIEYSEYELTWIGYSSLNVSGCCRNQRL